MSGYNELAETHWLQKCVVSSVITGAVASAAAWAFGMYMWRLEQEQQTKDLITKAAAITSETSRLWDEVHQLQEEDYDATIAQLTPMQAAAEKAVAGDWKEARRLTGEAYEMLEDRAFCRILKPRGCHRAGLRLSTTPRAASASPPAATVE